jgi:hypothetical protein
MALKSNCSKKNCVWLATSKLRIIIYNSIFLFYLTMTYLINQLKDSLPPMDKVGSQD